MVDRRAQWSDAESYITDARFNSCQMFNDKVVRYCIVVNIIFPSPRRSYINVTNQERQASVVADNRFIQHKNKRKDNVIRLALRLGSEMIG